MHIRACGRRWQCAFNGRVSGRRFQRFSRTDCFDRNGFDDQGAFRHQKAVARAVGALKRVARCRSFDERHDQRGIRARITQMDARDDANAFSRHVLRQHLVARSDREINQQVIEAPAVVVVELNLNRLLAHGGNVGKPHAIGGEHTGQRMNINARHAQRIGDEAGMLSAGAAETGECVGGDVVAALHRNLLNGIGHVSDGNVNETLGDLLGRARVAGGVADFISKRCELLTHDISVERLVTVRSEHMRKPCGLYFAEHDIAVGHRQRAALAITRWPRIGAGGIGADAVTRAVEMQDRSATGGNGVYVHHRSAHAYTGDLGVETALDVG